MQQASRQIADAVPAWVKATSLTILVINLLASILVIILLALPAANQFFRRGRAVPEANLAYPGYPPMPGYPQPPAGPPPAGPQPPAGPPPAGPPTEGS